MARPLNDEALGQVSSSLGSGQLALFLRMSTAGQRHSYQVYNELKSARQSNHDLLVAALLHDCGKARQRLDIWQRSLIVMVERWFPKAAANWGRSETLGWRRAFYVREQHAEWGAQLAEEAGCSPLAVRLIRFHQRDVIELKESDERHLLKQLQWADGSN